jgi:hypothetical protein
MTVAAHAFAVGKFLRKSLALSCVPLQSNERRRFSTRKVLTTGNVLLPFCVIDLGCGSGYLRVISPHQRKTFG